MPVRLWRTAFQLARQPCTSGNISRLSRSTQTRLQLIRRCSTETNSTQDTKEGWWTWDTDGLNNPESSLRLLEAIARDPQIANRIRKPYLRRDGYFQRVEDSPPDMAILYRLFESSPVLREAGLAPSDFGDELHQQLTAKDCWNHAPTSSEPDVGKEDTGLVPRYSQNAAAFLITHLPCAKQLCLPDRWQPCETSDQLIAAAVRLAHRDPTGPGLAQLEYIEARCLGFDIQFLALPNLRIFNVEEDIRVRQKRFSFIPLPTDLTFGHTLESIHLQDTRLDHESVEPILSHAPKLKNFLYTFGWMPEKEEDLDEDDSENLRLSDDEIRPGIDDPWDICQLVHTLQRRNGHSLEFLFLTMFETIYPSAPGTADFRGFPHLEELEISLEFFICQLQDSGIRSLVDFLPPSLKKLTIHTTGESEAHVRVLRGLFHNFKELSPQHLPLLKDVTLQCWDGIRDEPVGRQYEEILGDCMHRPNGLDVGVYWEEFQLYS